VTFEITDLPVNLLNTTRGRTIQIDANAGGYGRFTDATPWDHVDFWQWNGTRELIALPRSSAADRAELLAVVLPELGRVQGEDQEDEFAMKPSRSLDTRRVWHDDSLVDDPAEMCAEFEGPGLAPTLVDNYFATT
jgi:hypothetical protein